MNSLDTTNVILGVLAATAVAQFLLLLGVIVFFARQFSKLRDTITRFESTHLVALQDRANAVIADLHAIADRTERVGREVERTVRSAQAIVHVVGAEVERTTRGVGVALNLIGGGYLQAFAVGSGLRHGVREFFAGRRRREARLAADDIARFEAGA